MKFNLLTPAILCGCLISCSDNKDNINIQKGIQNDSSSKSASVVFDSPKIIDSPRIVIYPLILERTSYEGGSSISFTGERSTYWNFIFYNPEDQSKHLLVGNKKIAIFSFKTEEEGSSSPDGKQEGINAYRNNIFYEVVEKDFNQNNYLDNDDPTYLYVSDKKGNNFRKISPDDFNIYSWQVIDGTSKIILQAQKDSNGDKKFDRNDPTIPLIVDISTGESATETFGQNYIDTLKNTLTTIWKSRSK